jgi:hypothetical protein
MTVPTLREGLHMSFGQFWPIYLDAHRQPATRSCHYVATIAGATISLLSVLEGQFLIMAGGIMGAVCLAISSHKLIERNKPLIGVNPFYGAIADVRMCWLALRGKLAPEYVRLGLVPLSATIASVPDKV